MVGLAPGARGSPGAKSGPKGPARGPYPYLGAGRDGFGFADVSELSNITSTRRSAVRILLVACYYMFNFELL